MNPPKLPIYIVFLLILIAFLNVFSLSGIGAQLKIVEKCAFISVPALLWSISRKNRNVIILPRWMGIFYIIVVGLMTISMLMQWHRTFQLANYITLFGIVPWINLFGRIRWKKYDMTISGAVVALFGLFFTYLFLPGHAFEGWNSNSPVFSVPIALFGIVALNLSKNKLFKLSSYLFIYLLIMMLLQLENRSALIAGILFAVVMIFKRIIFKKNYFLIFSYFIIIGNVLFPLLQESILQLSIFQNTLDLSGQIVQKNLGLNGRDELWRNAISIANESPIYGYGGFRNLYPHNFSLDVAQQWGWLTVFAYYSVLLFVVTKCYKKNSPYNLYVAAFVCLMLMNTFENAFVSNGFFTIFPYVFLAITLQYNYTVKKWNTKKK